jgi:hypothetical protein
MKTAALTDTFATADATKWDYAATYGDVTATGQLHGINTTELHSVNSYDLTASQVIIQLANIGNGFTFGVYDDTVANGVAFTAENRFTLVVASADLSVFKAVPYSPVNHRWLRIRENAGTVYFDVSPDRSTWTVLKSGAYGVNPSLQVRFMGDNATVDNLN